jgi:hypothetical protein
MVFFGVVMIKNITISILRKKNERIYHWAVYRLTTRSLLHKIVFVGAYADTTVYVDNVFFTI